MHRRKFTDLFVSCLVTGHERARRKQYCDRALGRIHVASWLVGAFCDAFAVRSIKRLLFGTLIAW